jgi:hypothetical protein
MPSDDWQIADFKTLGSLHNERYGSGLLCGARSAGDGYRVGSGWCAGGRCDSGAAPCTSAPRLPQYATGKKKGKRIAQSQSTFRDTPS